MSPVVLKTLFSFELREAVRDEAAPDLPAPVVPPEHDARAGVGDRDVDRPDLLRRGRALVVSTGREVVRLGGGGWGGKGDERGSGRERKGTQVLFHDD
jgi:hypothetical protein